MSRADRGVLSAQGFPRHAVFAFEEYEADDGITKVRITHDGSPIGACLDDNSHVADGYRYHDVIHLAHAAVLGWSPVLRALLGLQRRSIADYDRVEDGARAKAIEEGLAACLYNLAYQHDFNLHALDWQCIGTFIRAGTKGLEVADRPLDAWRDAYAQAFSVLKFLETHHGGVVECDLGRQRVSVICLAE